MPPMYPIGPDGAGMYMHLVQHKMDAAELRDAMTRAVSRNDAAGARSLFDHAFWHKTAFKPDWFHLYIAVQNENRDMVKLLTTYGATWTEDQAKVAKLSLGAKCDAFKVLLRGAGIRTDYTAAELQAVAPESALRMNKRILDENRNSGHDVAAEEKTFYRNVHVTMANAVLQNNMPQALAALKLHPDAQNPRGYEVSDIFSDVLGDFLHSSSKRALLFVDRLLDAGVKLQPVNLDKISSLTLPQHYDLLPELDRRGLLQDDVQKLRRELISSWAFLQSDIDLDGYSLRVSETMVAQKRAQFQTAAEVICTPHNTVDAQDVEFFLRQHDRQSPRAPEALSHMDATLLETGFFSHKAFSAENLRHLAETPGLDAHVSAAFNKMAARRDIGGREIGHFLHKKRFATLERAMADGAFVPDRIETENIVDYLTRNMKKEEPSAEIIESLKILKNTGADLSRLRLRDYLGSSKPGMAKALLDLDMIEPRDINRVKLRKRCGATVGIAGMHIKDRHYAMREFAHQVELEKDDPAQYKPYREKSDVSYQRLYMLRQMKAITDMRKRRESPAVPPQGNDLQRLLADHRRRRDLENRDRQERLRQILQDARRRDQQRLDLDSEKLRKVLEDHRRKREAESEKMRKQMQEILKRKRGNNRFGY